MMKIDLLFALMIHLNRMIKKNNAIAMEKFLLDKKICVYPIHTEGDIVEKQLNLIVKT